MLHLLCFLLRAHGFCTLSIRPSEPFSETLAEPTSASVEDAGERMAAILIYPVSPRGGERRRGEEQDGDISSTLHHIRDIGSPPN